MEQKEEQVKTEIEDEQKWTQFVVPHEKDDKFFEFIKEKELMGVDRMYCALGDSVHYHYLIHVPEEMDLKEEPFCQKPMGAQEMELHCKQKKYPYYEKNYIVE